MAPIPEPSTKHVPAWKKLGLKLKFANEEPADVNGSQTKPNNIKKRKVLVENSELTVEVADADRPSKKPKKSKSKKDKSLVAVNGDSVSKIDDAAKESTFPVALSTQSSKRKSVSFTPETKTQDGLGIKQLYKIWFDKQIADDPSFDPSSISPALRSMLPPSIRPPEPISALTPSSSLSSTSNPEPKKPKKEKSKTKHKPSQAPSSSTEHLALTYLKTYHTSPGAWKFSKPHQNHLLKHLFSLTHVPSSCDPALLSYLRGLQGSARSRIRARALTIRKEDSEWLTSEPIEGEKMDQETTAQCLARRKRDYDAAVAHIKEMLRQKEDEREEKEWELLGDKAEWEQRVRKRRRAEVVLWGVGEDEEIVEDAVALSRHAIFGKNHTPVQAKAVSKGMGGVEQIDVGGIAKGSAGKKIVFGDDGVGVGNGVRNPQGPEAPNGVKKVEIKGAAEGAPARKYRKRKRRTTGVPDDDSSSSESSSSSSEESEEEKEVLSGKMVRNPNSNAQEGTSSSGSDSGSDSGTSSSGVDDSD